MSLSTKPRSLDLVAGPVPLLVRELAYVIIFISTSVLQGLKKPFWALAMGVLRQVIAPLILFSLATRLWGWGRDGIWWGIFGITWAAALVGMYIAQAMVQDQAAGDSAARKAAAVEPPLA